MGKLFLDKSAVIVAGGLSTRFGQDKGLLRLAGKPLIKHVLDAIGNMVEEKIVVSSSADQAENYKRILGSHVKVLVDKERLPSPLIGALTGLEEARGEYVLLLPCDTPLVSREILSLLLELRAGRYAVIPRWPNGYIEPLQAVYHTSSALEAATNTLRDGEMRMQCMVDKLHGIRYISTLVIQQLDPDFKTFFNINSTMDLKKAENMLRRRGSQANP